MHLPQTVFKSVPPNGSELTWQTSMLYADIVPLIYVNETICMVICPSTRFKSIVLWPVCCQDYPKINLTGEGPGAILSFKTFLSFTNRLLLLLLLSRFSHVLLCVTPQTAAHQAPLSLGFSRQEHWSGLPFPSPVHESEKWKWSRSVVSDS